MTSTKQIERFECETYKTGQFKDLQKEVIITFTDGSKLIVKPVDGDALNAYILEAPKSL